MTTLDEARFDAEFLELTSPFRVEILAHCYRMLGSVSEAEDLVQETYVRAWRAYGSFEGRSSIRTWLYRIATNACLTARERAARRPLPSGLFSAQARGDDSWPTVDESASWIEPIPGSLLTDDRADPASVVAARTGLRLGLIAVLQHLPANQRAVFLLRVVLQWRAREVADVLEISVPAVNSLLQRARKRVDELGPTEDAIIEPPDGDVRRQVDAYASAFERADIDSLVTLLVEDATFEMPPEPMWFDHRDDIGRFLARKMIVPGGWRVVATTANTQPAVALYITGENGRPHLEGVHVLSIGAEGITRIVVFRRPAAIAPFAMSSD
jgi:RNA polymerase sigma-70 factor (ECF subfamily)